MSKVTFKGKEYDVNGLVQECTGMAEELAKTAKIQEPLPENVDMTEEENKLVQQQVSHLSALAPKVPAESIYQIVAVTKSLPPQIVDAWWNAFIAKYLPNLADVLKKASRETQREHVSTLIQILSLLPDPTDSPYFRRFLRNSDVCAGLPTIIARHFVDGIKWKRPSGPGHICTLIIHTIHWCDASLGDDKKASVDKDVRARLRTKLEASIKQCKGRLEELQLIEMERLHGLLGAVEFLPGDQYASSTRGYLEGQVDMCRRPDCYEGDEASLRCSKCKCTRYCGKKCQTWHWKNGHKLNCFEPTF
ncbi:hypothetical protein PQX77_015146 [Marasmius sp. AFHP31]|nr:hypothetical protein PQX77_015146 [Marasmius sp. AFHP31]